MIEEVDGDAERLQVHAEPGEDKLTFANDVADWILARIDNDTQSLEEDPKAKSKL